MIIPQLQEQPNERHCTTTSGTYWVFGTAGQLVSTSEDSNFSLHPYVTKTGLRGVLTWKAFSGRSHYFCIPSAPCLQFQCQISAVRPFVRLWAPINNLLYSLPSLINLCCNNAPECVARGRLPAKRCYLSWHYAALHVHLTRSRAAQPNTEGECSIVTVNQLGISRSPSKMLETIPHFHLAGVDWRGRKAFWMFS